jgi:hypothetical protein
MRCGKEVPKSESEKLKPAEFSKRPKARTLQSWRGVGVSVFLALAVFVVFGQTAHFGFVNYDDDVYVYHNPKVTGGLTTHAIAWVFTHADCNFYHPLTMLSLMLDYQLHGLNAGGYHLTNVIVLLWPRCLPSIRSGWNRWRG